MTYSSLKEMLQKSLNAVILQLSSQSDGIEQDSLRSFYNRIPGGDFSTQTALRLRRQIFPLEYVSPLPLQLSAQSNQSAAEICSQLAEDFVQLGVASRTCDTLSLPLLLQTVLQEVKPTLSTGGHLGLQLGESALLPWMEFLSQAEAWSPWELKILPASSFEVKQSSLSLSLGLSPLGFIQHIHARSVALLQSVSASPGEPTGVISTNSVDLKGESGTPGSQASIGLNVETRKVIWALMNLVDGFYDFTSHHSLGQRGYAVSESVYQWLKGITLTSPTMTYPKAVLKAVRQTLRYLLENCLGYPAVESF